LLIGFWLLAFAWLYRLFFIVTERATSLISSKGFQFFEKEIKKEKRLILFKAFHD